MKANAQAIINRVLLGRTSLGAALSGLLLALAFPRIGLESLAWFGLAPLLLVMAKSPFRSGFIGGTVFFGVLLYWLNIAMTTYGRLHPFLSFAIYLMLVFYLALFWGGATWAACRLEKNLGYSPTLTLPILWTGMEFVRSYLLTGFPWAILGYSQQNHLILIQSADLVGVYGISFLLVLVNATLARLLLFFCHRSKQPFPCKVLLFTTTLFLLNLGYGLECLQFEPDAREKTIDVALVQGNIDQDTKWDPSNRERTVEIYRKLSLEAQHLNGVDLIIWPESAMPFYFQKNHILAAEVRTTARKARSYLLFGSPATENSSAGTRYLNSAFLLSPSGEFLGRSDKVHLVPFGEYVPLKPLLPFIESWLRVSGTFRPARSAPCP